MLRKILTVWVASLVLFSSQTAVAETQVTKRSMTTPELNQLIDRFSSTYGDAMERENYTRSAQMPTSGTKVMNGVIAFEHNWDMIYLAQIEITVDYASGEINGVVFDVRDVYEAAPVAGRFVFDGAVKTGRTGGFTGLVTGDLAHFATREFKFDGNFLGNKAQVMFGIRDGTAFSGGDNIVVQFVAE